MLKAHVRDGVVVNVELVDPDRIPEHARDWPEVQKGVAKGWTYDGETFAEPEPAPASEDMIEAEAEARVRLVASDRQQRRLMAERQVLAGKPSFTSDEQARAAEIDGIFATIAAIWAAADALIEAGCPADFQDDKHWP